MSSQKNLKIQISIRRAADDGPLFQKQDGDRFDENITIKMNVETKYTIFVTTRPARTVQRVLIKAEKLELNRQKPERNDDNCCVYHADWSTLGLPASKNSARSCLPLIIEMEDGACLDVKLQVKFYPEKETTHSKWGQEFHMLDLDCVQKSGEHTIEIKKLQYI